MRQLYTPWRWKYVTRGREENAGCVFCRAARSTDPAATLTVLVAEHNVILMNLYPYANGHVLIAPIAHARDLAEAGPACRAEMMELTVRVQEAAEAEWAPHGFNIGMNLGEAAGAGIAEHCHLHVVPRWRNDSNFMTTTAGVRVVPEEIRESWRRLRTRLSGEA